MNHVFETGFFSAPAEVFVRRSPDQAKCEGQWLPDAPQILLALGAAASFALSTLMTNVIAAPAFSSDVMMAPSIAAPEGIPEYERWLHNDPAAWMAYREGFDSAKAGEIVSLGSFSAFLDDSED